MCIRDRVAGTALIFAAEVFDLWLIAKLAFVSVMAMAHAWIGHLIEQSGQQRRGQGVDPARGYRMPYPGIALAAILPAIGAILWLVLAKPDLTWVVELMPQIVQEPRGQLP